MIIVVSPGQPIQTAINLAAPGDTIVVRPGVYTTGLTIPVGKDRLRLQGAGPGKTILENTGFPSGILVLNSDFVTITGFTLRGYNQYGVQLQDANECIVRNNIIEETTGEGIFGHGIGIGGSGDGHLIYDNIIRANRFNGVHIEVGTRHAVIGNEIKKNMQHGIEIIGDYSLVAENKVTDNSERGIRVDGNGHWIVKNEVCGNGSHGISGSSDEANNLFVFGNNSSGNGSDGLSVFDSGHVIVDNTFNEDEGHGIFVSSNEALIYANEIERNEQTNVNASSSFSLSLVLDNDIKKSEDEGFDPVGGDANRFLFNRIIDNENTGLPIDNGTFNVVDNNVIEDNGESGIRLQPTAENNAIRSNKLEDNKPYDIEAQTPADDNNTFDLNKCEKSLPPEICS